MSVRPNPAMARPRSINWPNSCQLLSSEQFPAGQAIDFFGFSMGGIIGRVYLQQMGGWQRIRRFITASTPHRGTFTAYLMPFHAAVQMRPTSRLLRSLNADLSFLEQTRFVSIYTPLDLTIVPYTRSRLPVGEFRRVWTPFHAYVPFDRRVMAVVAESLRSSEN